MISFIIEIILTAHRSVISKKNYDKNLENEIPTSEKSSEKLLSELDEFLKQRKTRERRKIT